MIPSKRNNLTFLPVVAAKVLFPPMIRTFVDYVQKKIKGKKNVIWQPLSM